VTRERLGTKIDQGLAAIRNGERELGELLLEQVRDAIEADCTDVELGFCIGKECLANHGVRLATRRGLGPCSIYIVCDECYEQRLTPEEREHMIELEGVDRVRHLGLHELHNGRFPKGEVEKW